MVKDIPKLDSINACKVLQLWNKHYSIEMDNNEELYFSDFLYSLGLICVNSDCVDGWTVFRIVDLDKWNIVKESTWGKV